MEKFWIKVNFLNKSCNFSFILQPKSAKMTITIQEILFINKKKFKIFTKTGSCDLCCKSNYEVSQAMDLKKMCWELIWPIPIEKILKPFLSLMNSVKTREANKRNLMHSMINWLVTLEDRVKKRGGGKGNLRNSYGGGLQ